jgi:hypothetical protein
VPHQARLETELHDRGRDADMDLMDTGQSMSAVSSEFASSRRVLGEAPGVDPRFYRDRYAVWFMRCQAILVIGLAFILAAGSPPHGNFVALRIAAGVAMIGGIVWFRYGLRRMRLEVAANGLRVGVLRRRFLPWSDVKRFTARRRPNGIYPTVVVELASGELVRTILVQGRKMFWNGGSSNDIVAVLNDQLDRARR